MSGIVFLDFDGVLVPESQYRLAEDRLMVDRSTLLSMMADAPVDALLAIPSAVRALNRITDTSGADIVVSSSWRSYGLEVCADVLRKWGVTGRVVGITPGGTGTGYYDEGPRGRAIRQYLKWDGLGPSFVILDDLPLSHFDGLGRNFVRVNEDTGLTERDADMALRVLSRHPEGERMLLTQASGELVR